MGNLLHVIAGTSLLQEQGREARLLRCGLLLYLRTAHSFGSRGRGSTYCSIPFSFVFQNSIHPHTFQPVTKCSSDKDDIPGNKSDEPSSSAS